MKILMVASENDGIARCKVGGIGDVIRDVPAALSNEGCTVSVVTPSYGFLHETPGSEHIETFRFFFGGKPQQADLFRVRPRTAVCERVTHYVVDHSSFLHYNDSREGYEIYSHDEADRPFATDATKFACFGAALAQLLKQNLFGELDVLHLHDWHASFLLMLKGFDPSCTHLNNYRTVFTVHNLAMQGIRPFANEPSSLAEWYPEIKQTAELSEALADPRWPDCINPLAAGIRLADAVHAVSPSYAEEIQRPSRPPRYFGGEGLEEDLQAANDSGRLHGILNGCEYPEEPLAPTMNHADLIAAIKKETARWSARRGTLSFADLLVFSRLEKLQNSNKQYETILTGVSRIVDQKMLLLRAPGSDGATGLETILNVLGEDGIYILLGTGDPSLEETLTLASAIHSNFIFLNHYSDELAEMLYENGDLFLMPNSFEPCGACQMLSMRAGQPCLVHETGGLRDTIHHGKTGFSFSGDSLSNQVDAMMEALKSALTLRSEAPGEWNAIREAATAKRFSWADSAKLYIKQLYSA